MEGTIWQLETKISFSHTLSRTIIEEWTINQLLDYALRVKPQECENHCTIN